MTTASVSKGCFYFEGRKQKKRKTLNTGDYFTDDSGKLTLLKKLQWETYQSCWSDVNRDIQDLQSEVNNKIFEDLVQFVRSAHQGFRLSHDDDDGDGTARKKTVHEIPTAALITGVNTPDHTDMFSHLTLLLRNQITPYIATLGSKACQNMKSTMSNLLSQFIGSAYDLDDEEETDEKSDVNMRRIPCTMPVLCGWYQDKTKKSHSPSKSSAKSPSKTRKHGSPSKRKSGPHFAQFPPLVLLLEDFENFSSRVLQDLILICSQYLPSLPIVLIFGIATSVTAVHRLLPHTVSSVLSMEKFQAQPATEYLTKVIDKILLTDVQPFKLNDKVFQLLLDCFLYHDFSVLTFIRGYQFAMMDHFFEQPAAVLCCPYIDAIERIKTFDSKTLDQFRRLQSFRRYVEKQQPQEQKSLLIDDKHFKNVLQQMVEDLWTYHTNFHPMMHCLHILTFELPGHPMGKRLRELYALCLQGDIVQNENYQDAKKLVKLMARDELVTLLAKISDYLAKENYDSDEFDNIKIQLDTFIAQFNSLDDLNEPVDRKQEETNDPPTTPKPVKTNLYQLQKQLRESARKKKAPSRYEALRAETLDYLEEIFGKYLRSPMSFPMYEIFYYESVSTVRRHLNASPRAAIQTALTNPHYYLQCDCCEADPVGLPVNAPDVCIAYKLHLECGRLINLYDWLQAFITVVGNEEDEDDGDQKSQQTKSPDQVLHARFIRAVSELQFLGFIKPTKKKTDHVARLTWGGC